MTKKQTTAAKTKATNPAKRERPTVYTPELGEEICRRIALREPMSKITADTHLPTERTIYRWKLEHEDFAVGIARAREHRAESRSDYIDDLVEQVRLGKLDPHSAKVMIDAEKWQASKEQPRKFGDKVEVSGKDGGPIQVSLTNLERARRIALLLAETVENGVAAPPVLAGLLGKPSDERS